MHSKRSLTVIKELEPPSPKRKLYVTHKVTDTASVTEEDFRESLKGNSSPQKAIRKADGTYVSWSILGDAASYEHLEGGGGADNASTASGGASVRTSRSSRSRNKTGSRTGKKSSSKLLNVPVDPNQELKDHIAALAKFKGDAQKVRNKEKAEEELILTKLPVHEKFSLNKEGKAISKWQERLNDWSKIENRLARRVGGSTKTLLMNTGDEYRGKNEEYDLMQAAIPIEEKFGPNSWMMMLRGGGEQNVPVGHIFSGLVCKVTTKQYIPKMLRKPLLGSEPRTKDTFLDNTPAMTMKREKLKKKLETIRPYTMGPSVADGLIVFSTNLFDWAHDSSKRILIEREEAARYEDEMRQQRLLEEQSKNAGHVAEVPVSSLRVLTPVNMVFTCLKGEGVGNTFTFTNTGRATVTYTWTCDVNRFEEVKRPVWTVLEEREDKSREYLLAKDRSLFFCPRASGRILPGETVHTRFIYCNRACGGSVSEQWVLQLSPQVTVTYADHGKRAAEGEQGGQAAQAMPPTSKISVVLRGQSYTLDQSGYRRKEVADNILEGTEAAFVRDQILTCVRRVRSPVRPLDLQQRKINYFMVRNAAILHELSDIFCESLPLYLNYERLLDFEAYYVKCQEFALAMHSKCAETVQRWEELSGASGEQVPKVNLGESGSLRLAAMCEAIFPEKKLEIFDEISEEDINPTWDFDLTRMFAICNSARSIVATIVETEDKIREKIAADEKAAAKAARRAAAGSDDEESEEEEEEEEDEEPKPVVIHPLTAQMSSLSFGVDALMHRLVVQPVALPEEDAREALVAALDAFEDLELASRSVAGIVPESVMPIFESPFTSEEGKAKWDAALNPPPEPEDTGKKGKKAPEKKDKKKDKGAAGEIPVVEPEQANVFYKDVCQSVVSSVVAGLVENMFCVVDSRLEAEARGRLAAPGRGAVAQIAVLRKEDVPEKGVVFVSVPGEAFFSKKQRGAFDSSRAVREQCAGPVVLAAESGAACVVLVNESLSEVGVLAVDDTSALQESLGAAAAASAARQELARPKPKKKDPPLPSIPPVKFKVSVVASFAELEVALQKLKGEDSAKRKSFPVYVLQDIKSPAVVPRDLVLPDEVDDDDDCPIPVGEREHQARRLAKWNAAGPKKVGVSTAAGLVEIYAGPAEALADVVTRYSETSSCLWVECNPAIVFAPLSVSAMQRCAEMLNKQGSMGFKRVVSGGLRDLVSWFSAVSQVPRVPDVVAAKSASAESVDAFSDHIFSLFKDCENVSPSLLAVVGGSLRLDKFMLIDKLLDSASVIYLAGELCIPFIAIERSVELSRYTETCETYKNVCTELLKKARLRGVRLLTPVDVVEGDEAVTSEQKGICFQKIEPGARDEGADYPGETKTVALPDFETVGGVYVDTPRMKISGFIYDMGPASCQQLKEAIESSEMLLSWGPVGCVEFSSFQAGQRVLVTTAAKKPYAEDDEPAAIAANAAALPLYSVALGDSCVEWWSRMADSEGELGGELARFGVVSCTSRDSSVACGFITCFESSVVMNLSKREASYEEWLYNRRPPPPAEEEEEEEDEEDD